MKIIILGSSGMLGKYITTYLKNACKEYTIIPIARKDFEINLDTNYERVFGFLENQYLTSNDIIINCIGLIKPQVQKYGIALSLIVNSLFPNLLAKYCEDNNFKLIHITTDCIFSGKKGRYIETDLCDVTDIYGRTKSLGEPDNCTVIRTSIIGEEVKNQRSLLEWVKSNAGKEINGFEDHLWNGVTCLELAIAIEEIISNNLFWQGVQHIYSNSVSKYELLCIINKIYNLNIKIKKINSGNPCDRTLSSISHPLPLRPISLENQIKEMKEYHDILIK